MRKLQSCLFFLILTTSTISFAGDPNSTYRCGVKVDEQAHVKDISLQDPLFIVEFTDGYVVDINFVWDGTYNVRLLRADGSEVFGMIADGEFRNLRLPDNQVTITCSLMNSALL